jgi:uncharacterized membrane protein
MARPFKRRSRLRRTFVVRGFAALLPTLLTVFLLITGFNLLNQYLGEPLVGFVNQVIGKVQDDAGRSVDFLTPGSWQGIVITVALSLAACFLVGFVLATFAGGRIYSTVEGWIVELPIIKKIYPYAKQVTDFFFREKPMEWSAVVAIQYPRQGIWSIGFITAEGIGEISKKVGSRLVSVYAPTSPVPFTGYVVLVRPEEIIPLRMTVEEAIRWVASAGVVLPGGEPYRRPILHPPGGHDDMPPPPMAPPRLPPASTGPARPPSPPPTASD